MNLKGNVAAIPNWNDNKSNVIKNPNEIEEIRKLQNKWLKKNKIKRYGISLNDYKLVKLKEF